MVNYVGITIGPIFDTITEATTPAGLWFASTMFSDITRRLLIEIKNEFKKDIKVYSPAFDEKDKDGLSDGVGKYHDRIIFSIEEEKSTIKEKLDNIIKLVKEDTEKIFVENVIDDNFKSFLREYLQINYVVLNEEQVGKDNCILVISPFLDALELMYKFPVNNKYNKIQETVRRKETDVIEEKNRSVRDSKLFEIIRNGDFPQFYVRGKNEKHIRSIEEIAAQSGNEKYKPYKYYAVVSADADGMGNFLKGIESDDTIKFSDYCLEYDKAASKQIGEYGGMTIYAGGDDLLFLAPICNGSKTIFEFCREIAELFNEKIKIGPFKDASVPTISFGISIQYVRYPLYEALNRSRDMLHLAKTERNNKQIKEKDCQAIFVEKHSGQSVKVCIGNEEFGGIESKDDSNKKAGAVYKIMHALIDEDNQIDENTIKNFATKIEEHYYVISQMDKNVRGNSVTAYSSWANLFDNDEQKKKLKFIKTINQVYYDEIIRNVNGSPCRIESLYEKEKYVNDEEGKMGERPNQELNALIDILRIAKLYREANGDE